MDDYRKDPDYDPIAEYRAFACDGCEHPIYVGEDYHLIDGYCFCPDCAKGYANKLLKESLTQA